MAKWDRLALKFRDASTADESVLVERFDRRARLWACSHGHSVAEVDFNVGGFAFWDSTVIGGPVEHQVAWLEVFSGYLGVFVSFLVASCVGALVVETSLVECIVHQAGAVEFSISLSAKDVFGALLGSSGVDEFGYASRSGFWLRLSDGRSDWRSDWRSWGGLNGRSDRNVGSLTWHRGVASTFVAVVGIAVDGLGRDLLLAGIAISVGWTHHLRQHRLQQFSAAQVLTAQINLIRTSGRGDPGSFLSVPN